MLEAIKNLEEILKTADELPWNYALYLSQEKPWNRDTLCTVLNPNNCEDEDEEPPFAKQHAFIYGLGINDVQDIVNNAKQQEAEIGIDGLVKAFLYYYDNDAFIEFPA
jgi:hypothetical protein